MPEAVAAASRFICRSTWGWIGSFSGETSFNKIGDLVMLTFAILNCRSQKFDSVQSEPVPFDMCRAGLILLVTLALSTVSMAGSYEFKVLYAHVPGIEMALAGNIDAAIEVLENRARNVDSYYVADEQATLCALYVVSGQIDAARETCNSAIEIDQSDLAYNNRGVLRVHLGDTVGALEDFDRARVRPEDQHRYIEELKLGNTRLMANRNFTIAVEYNEKRSANKRTMAGTVTGAHIEDLVN